MADCLGKPRADRAKPGVGQSHRLRGQLRVGIIVAVDKEHRVQANASNCYGKKYAIFLPQYDAMFSPVFREQPRGRKCYFELSADFAADPAMQMDYVLHLLETMRSHRK